MNTIHERVYNFKTRHREGFTDAELTELLKDFPAIDKEKFDNALRGITCMMKEGELVIFHCDIEKAIYCGIEKRNLHNWEWD